MSRKKHHNDGPTFSEATYKRQSPNPPSPDRVRAQLEETMRDAADHKLLATDTRAWLRKRGLLKKG